MPLLTEIQTKEEMEQIRDFLNELGFVSEILPKGNMIEQNCLLIDMFDGEDAEEDDFSSLLAAYVMQMSSEEENQLTKYLVLYFMAPQELSGIDETKIWTLVNQMNQQIRMGCFFFGETTGVQGPEKRVQYRMTIGESTDRRWDEGVVCEAILEIEEYFARMKDALQNILE